jgi:hypothetical protein
MKTKEIILWLATGLAIAWFIYKGDYATIPVIVAAIALARLFQREQ